MAGFSVANNDMNAGLIKLPNAGEAAFLNLLAAATPPPGGFVVLMRAEPVR